MAQTRAAQTQGLSADNIRGLREVLTGGGSPTVWFTSSAVGVEQGKSGKVVALGEQTDGDFIQVRPAGSKDVLSFSAGEVTVVKPERKPKESSTRSAESTRKQASQESTADEQGVGAEPKAQQSAAAHKDAIGKETAAQKMDAASGAQTKSESRRKPRQSANQPGGVITLTAGPEGQWNVEVSNGKKRVLRPTSVPASAVAQAARALSEDVAQAVEPLLQAAREQQQARVEQLERELSDAQRALADLTE